MKVITRFCLCCFWVAICSCGSVSNISKGLDNETIIYSTNNINFFEFHRPKINVYFKISNFSIAPKDFMQTFFAEHIKLGDKYRVVESAEEAELIVEIKVMTVLPIEEETVAKLSKYWLYLNSTQPLIVDSSDKLEPATTMLIDDADIVLLTGKGKHDFKANHNSAKNNNKKDSGLSKISGDAMAGAILGGSITAIFTLSPAIISAVAVAGAGVGPVFQLLTSVNYNIGIVDIIIKEKIHNNAANAKSKYKNISSLSRNVIKEVYVNNVAKNEPIFLDHGTRLFVISGKMKILRNDINLTIANAVVRTVSEILQ